jgi:hypothetical protein
MRQPPEKSVNRPRIMKIVMPNVNQPVLRGVAFFSFLRWKGIYAMVNIEKMLPRRAMGYAQLYEKR